MMKVIILVPLIVCLSVVCCGADDLKAHWEEWIQFNEEIKTELCKPDKTDDKVLDDMHSCMLTIAELNDDKIKEFQKFNEPIYKKCAVPNEGDVSGYTKVDLTKDLHKRYLLGYCSEKLRTCAIEQYNELKENGQWKEQAESLKLNLTDDKKKELKECMKKAVGIKV